MNIKPPLKGEVADTIAQREKFEQIREANVVQQKIYPTPESDSSKLLVPQEVSAKSNNANCVC